MFFQSLCKLELFNTVLEEQLIKSLNFLQSEHELHLLWLQLHLLGVFLNFLLSLHVFQSQNF